MKKYFNFESMTKFVLFVFAAIFGGVGMAITSPEVGKYGSDDDPNAGNPLEGAVGTNPDDKGGIVQHGKDANASALQQANLLDNKMFQKIIEYHALRYPFYTAMFTKATQFAFKGHKEAEYPEIGDIRTEARTKAAVSNDGKAHSLNIYSALYANDATMFRPNYTIIIPSIEGYDEGETTVSNGEALMLYITKNDDAETLNVEAINGPAISASNPTTYVPAIPAGTLFMLGAPALAEEEVEVDPINAMPTIKKAYLQKKGYSVAITNFFEEAVKEVDWEKDRIKRQALDAYKKLYTVTALFGAKRKFNKRNKNGVRLCYTQDGLINQIRMAYQLQNGVWTKNDVIAITKMLFTTYTDATTMEIFMGSDAMESLLKIEWGDNATKVVYQYDDNLKVKVATIETSFGTLKFTHEVALTQFHMEKAAIAIPMEECMRVYRDNGSTKSVDGNKGETGQVEELTKEFFVQDDCFICTAMNSMLIGPESVFSMAKAIEEVYESVTVLPTADADHLDKIVYLTTATGTSEAGLYKCNLQSDGSYKWESYKRDFNV